MNDTFQGTRFLRAVGMTLALALLVWVPAFTQQPVEVSGTVTSTVGGRPVSGVTVRVRGSNTSTVTDAQGKYTVAVPPDAVLVFSLIGYRGSAQTVAGRSSVNVTLEPAISVLPDVVVTGYQTQLRKDFTGAASSVKTESVEKQTSTSVLQRLDGRVAGVTIDDGGSPGSRTTVRIRGVTSFQNNDPLYVVDGTPIQDSYLNWLNPDEIASIDVLKDASAMSIYGSRASNGVVVIETKRGKPGRRQVSLDVRTGMAAPSRGMNDILELNSLNYFQVVKTAYRNAGLNVPTNIYGSDTLGNNPSVPAYIWPNPCGTKKVPAPCTNVDTSTYKFPDALIMPGSAGTDWWKAVFGTGAFRNANLAVSGGGEDNSYHVSFNYLDQDGAAAYTRLQRGAVRINTAFSLDRVSVGENIALSREQHHGGLDDDALGEDNIIGKNIMQQPVVPIYDIRGYFASGKAVGLSNLTNPLKIAYSGQHNIATNDRMFGNVFGGFDAHHGISLKTRFGFNLSQNSYHGFSPTTPENSEVTSVDGINENYRLQTEWTWTNTLNYLRTFGQHSLTVLLGHEANEFTERFEAGNCANLLNESLDSRYITDALCDPTTKNVSSSGGKSTLLSFFGKADYNFADRYYLNFTLRRDGSSHFAAENRWATFPAVGAGWRLSRESFMRNSPFSNLMLRFGWGVTGNQLIPPGRIVNTYGGDRGDTFYDIGGSSVSSIQPGFKLTANGNEHMKWEENRSVNVGLDLEFLEGRATISADLYRRNSNNLLFDPRTPATAGSASPPIINIGRMRNNGIDFSIGYRGNLGAATVWSATFNGSHYTNKILQIDNLGTQSFVGPISLREQNPVINMVGQPIGAFYGLVADGYYKDSLDAAPFWNDGARPGRIKFKDLNGDGSITSADATIIGSPHPKFTGGLDLSLRHGDWDVSATLFGTFGNKIFNAQKYWYVFRYFDTNVRADLQANSVVLDGICGQTPPVPPDTVPGFACPGKVTNPNAKYPRLDVNDAAWSRQFSSYWVEDGSYVRLRSLQIGYNVPPGLVRWIPVARIYIQAENLFTLTGYSGLDPALPTWSTFGAAGDQRDQFRGVDEGSYPTNRTFTIGISTNF